MASEVKETTAEVRMDFKVREFYDLKAAIKVTEGRARDLGAEIEEWMGEDDQLEVEGLPVLERKTRTLGKFWDSHAIQKIAVESPAEWERLMELGCVVLDAGAVKRAIEKGQLLRTPDGWIEHQGKPFLQFRR